TLIGVTEQLSFRIEPHHVSAGILGVTADIMNGGRGSASGEGFCCTEQDARLLDGGGQGGDDRSRLVRVDQRGGEGQHARSGGNRGGTGVHCLLLPGVLDYSGRPGRTLVAGDTPAGTVADTQRRGARQRLGSDLRMRPPVDIGNLQDEPVAPQAPVHVAGTDDDRLPPVGTGGGGNAVENPERRVLRFRPAGREGLPVPGESIRGYFHLRDFQDRETGEDSAGIESRIRPVWGRGASACSWSYCYPVIRTVKNLD